MKILCLAFEFPLSEQDPIVSGEIKNAYNFITEMHDQGHEVTVINVTERDIANEYRVGTITVRVVHDIKTRGVVRYLYRAMKIMAIINQLRRNGEAFDLIHSHISYGTLGVLLSASRDTPLITTPHGTNIPEIKTELTGSLKDRLRRVNAELQRWLDMYGFTRSKLIISVSLFQLKEMRGIYSVKDEKMQVIYNGVNRSRYAPSIKAPSVLGGPLKVLFIGRACKKKGIDKIKTLAERNPSWQFDLVIGTPMFNTIGSQLIDEIRALPNCRVHESVPEPELPAFYQSADVTVVPSHGYESLPTVILESIACGTPAVSVNAWGNPEVILAPELMFAEDNIRDMERAIHAATRNRLDMQTTYAVKSLSVEVNQLLALVKPHLGIEK